jgi:phospholipid transport system substrate-binding protein
MRKLSFSLIVLVSLILLLYRNPVQAGTPAEQVKTMLEEVMAIQTDPQLQGSESRQNRSAAIKRVIIRNFHFDTMARQALGPHWEQLSEARRKEFKTIFQDLFLDSYSRLVLDFLKREKILYTKEDLRPDQALVNTLISRVNEEIPVDYCLKPVAGKWMVQDVKIDGVSIIQNYQKSFLRVIKQESYESLLKKMRLQQQTLEKTP